MKFNDIYLSGSAFLQNFGIQKLLDLKKTAESTNVLNCPFCGGEPELKLGNFPAPGVLIMCSKCACRTLLYNEGVIIGSGKVGVPAREIKEVIGCFFEAVRIWNSRTGPAPESNQD